MFKVGDKVVCVNNEKIEPILTVGNTYEIEEISSPWNDGTLFLRLYDEKLRITGFYPQNRFKKVEEKYSSCKSVEVDNLQEEYGPVSKVVDKTTQIKYHLDKLKELTCSGL